MYDFLQVLVCHWREIYVDTGPRRDIMQGIGVILYKNNFFQME